MDHCTNCENLTYYHIMECSMLNLSILPYWNIYILNETFMNTHLLINASNLFEALRLRIYSYLKLTHDPYMSRGNIFFLKKRICNWVFFRMFKNILLFQDWTGPRCICHLNCCRLVDWWPVRNGSGKNIWPGRHGWPIRYLVISALYRILIYWLYDTYRIIHFSYMMLQTIHFCLNLCYFGHSNSHEICGHIKFCGLKLGKMYRISLYVYHDMYHIA